MKYLLLVSSLVSLLVSSTIASYRISTMLASTSQKVASSSMKSPSSTMSSLSVISSTFVAPTSADVSSTISLAPAPSQTATSHQTATSCQTATSHQTASFSTPIVPTPSESSAGPSTSVPPTGKPTTPTSKPRNPIEFDYYKYPNTTNVTCVAVQGIITLTVMTNGTGYTVQIKRNVTAKKGSCQTASHDSSSIYAKWDNCMIGMEFRFINKDDWYLHKIVAEVYKNGTHGDVKASSTFSGTRTDHLYQGSANQTYTCEAETKLVLNITGGKGSITVDFRDLKIQPFPVNGSKFPNPKSCPNDNPNDGGSSSNSIVPIAVGCALAGLIVIVLIAYLIGRRKSNKGYQQV